MINDEHNKESKTLRLDEFSSEIHRVKNASLAPLWVRKRNKNDVGFCSFTAVINALQLTVPSENISLIVVSYTRKIVLSPICLANKQGL